MEKNLVQKIMTAQEKMGKAIRNQYNDHLRFAYSDLNSIIDATRPVFAEEGLLIYQEVAYEDGITYVETFISDGDNTHGFGKLGIKVSPSIGQGGKPAEVITAQNHGAAMTYARRYSWQLATGIGEDEGGEHAVGQQQRAQPQQRQNQQQRAPGNAARPQQRQNQPRQQPKQAPAQSAPKEAQQRSSTSPKETGQSSATANGNGKMSAQDRASRARDLLDGLDPDPMAALPIDKYQNMLNYLELWDNFDVHILGKPVLEWIQDDPTRNVRAAAVTVLEYLAAPASTGGESDIPY